MIKLEKTSVMNFENAVRGARNPMNSWEKSDSYYDIEEDPSPINPVDWAIYRLGENDLDLCKRLCKAGPDERKFMRQIFVSVDVTAPMYWWAEADTYKIGTVRNSCSKMHKIHSKPIELSDFSIDNFNVDDDYNEIDLEDMFINVVADCEMLRQKFLETKDKRYWKGLIQLLPASYNQLSTLTLNYETLTNIYHARRTHKLDEWHDFCKWIESLPYSELITGGKDNE